MTPKSLVYFKEIEDWQDKYEAILELGQTLKPLDSKLKIESNRVIGCQSRVWLILEWVDEKLQIQVEADSRLVQGLMALVKEVYADKTKSEIRQIGNNWISELCLDTNLSMVRRSGMDAVIGKILAFE